MLNEYGITNVLVINNARNDYNYNFSSCIKVTKININENQIDFDYTNYTLFEMIKTFKNILILSENNTLGFVIVSSFCMNFLNNTIIQIIIMSNFYEINLNNTNYLEQLENYKKIQKLK
jgi:hypothetical protein